MTDEVINYERLIFEVYGHITQDEGVTIISSIVDEYLNSFYSNRATQIYLKQHSLGYQNLEVTLYVSDGHGKNVCDPFITTFSLREGVLSYRILNATTCDYLNPKSCWKEPYEDAAKRLGLWPPVGPKGSDEESS